MTTYISNANTHVGESGAGKTENTKKVITYFAILGADPRAKVNMNYYTNLKKNNNFFSLNLIFQFLIALFFLHNGKVLSKFQALQIKYLVV